MTNVIVHGDKFALVAFETRSAVDLPPTELTPGLWASSESMIGLDGFWREVLGTIQVENFRSCTLFLLVKEHADDPAVDALDQALRDQVYRFYTGMLLADRYGTDQEPFLISGHCDPDRINVRQVERLEPARHASADRWHRLSTNEVRRGAEIGRAVQNFPMDRSVPSRSCSAPLHGSEDAA